MKTDIGISEQNKKAVSEILSKLLADEYILYTKTRNYHWNVVGPHFNDLHKFFEGQYESLDASIDEIAERIRSLGSKTPSTLGEFVKTSRLAEHPGKYPDAQTMVQNLLADHEKVIQYLREDVDACGEKYHDAGTQDFLTGLMEEHEKTAWMIRSVLEK